MDIEKIIEAFIPKIKAQLEPVQYLFILIKAISCKHEKAKLPPPIVHFRGLTVRKPNVFKKVTPINVRSMG